MTTAKHNEIRDIAQSMRESRRPTRHKRSSGGFWLGVLGVVVSVAIVVGVSVLTQALQRPEKSSEPGQARAVPATEKASPVAALVWGTPEEQLIRAFLKNETPTGKWEEIRWSEKNSPDLGYPMTTLDFRTENEFGGMTKHYLQARYIPGSDRVAMAGYRLSFLEWISPENYDLPPVSRTKNIRPVNKEDYQPNILERLQKDASDRMGKRRISGN